MHAELKRLESDVALAAQRRERDAGRLASTQNAKDAVALEQEITSLGRRISDLEDAELELMARLEDADAAVAAQQALIDETVAEGTRLTTEAKAQIAAATSTGEQLARDRARSSTRSRRRSWPSISAGSGARRVRRCCAGRRAKAAGWCSPARI